MMPGPSASLSGGLVKMNSVTRGAASTCRLKFKFLTEARVDVTRADNSACDGQPGALLRSGDDGSGFCLWQWPGCSSCRMTLVCCEHPLKVQFRLHTCEYASPVMMAIDMTTAKWLLAGFIRSHSSTCLCVASNRRFRKRGATAPARTVGIALFAMVVSLF